MNILNYFKKNIFFVLKYLDNFLKLRVPHEKKDFMNFFEGMIIYLLSHQKKLK